MLLPFALLLGQSTEPSGVWQGQEWRVNPAHALIWDGRAYTPVGLAVPAATEAIRKAESAGVKDLMIEASLTDDWAAAFAAAERLSARYLLSLNERMPQASGWLCTPEALRVLNVSHRSVVEVALPGAVRAYFVVVGPSSSIMARGWATMHFGKASVEVNLKVSADDYQVLLFPLMRESDLVDYWEGLDARRDEVIRKLRDAAPGKGLRGIVNPFGRPPSHFLSLRERVGVRAADGWTTSGGIVPDSILFRLEFEQYLREKYQTIEALARAWRIDPLGLKTFAEAAALIPLFSPDMGVDAFLDPVNDRTVSGRRVGSRFWDDVQVVIESACVRRLSRLASATRSIANVPVVYDWAGWSPLHERRDIAGDGIGIPTVGAGRTIDSLSLWERVGVRAADALSSALAWGSRSWIVSTRICFSENGAPFPTEAQLRSVIAALVDLGVKGWFVESTGGDEAVWVAAMNGEAQQDLALGDRSPRAIFYPINARYPADTMQLPGGVWWLPTPAAGDRLDVGANYEAYRLTAPYDRHIAIWTTGAPRKTKLLTPNPQSVTLHSVSGMAVDARVVRDGIEVTIRNEPLLIFGADTTPVPEDAVQELVEAEAAITAEAVRKGADITEERFLFADALRKAKTSPGASLMQMTEAYRRMLLKVAPYVWREGERADSAGLGVRMQSAGCSQGEALRLRLAIPARFVQVDGRDGFNGMRAVYKLSVSGSRDEHTVWLAARIPEESRPFVRVEVKGDSLSPWERVGVRAALSAPPVSEYGDGFGWYQVGTMLLPKGEYEFTVSMDPGAPVMDMAIDVLLATPQPFRPSGPRMPRFLR
ncbi:MAG: hypothetical protein C4341_00410 [Armatimonadota bacterium]